MEVIIGRLACYLRGNHPLTPGSSWTGFVNPKAKTHV
jgi:hypothetical protein